MAGDGSGGSVCEYGDQGGIREGEASPFTLCNYSVVCIYHCISQLGSVFI